MSQVLTRLWKAIVGHNGIRKCNANGELLLGVCAEHILMVTNALIQFRNGQKTTWKHPRSKQWHIVCATYSTMSLQEQETEETCISYDPCLEHMTVGQTIASSSLVSISRFSNHLSKSQQTFLIADSTVISFGIDYSTVISFWTPRHRIPSEKSLIRI